MKVIGLGVGRTGTYSLKKALERLGYGPCHHMEEVLQHKTEQVPLWAEAADGRPDWDAIYSGYESAVDWPTAGFARELAAAYPAAKFIVTVRSPESWAESYSATIGKVILMRTQLPPEMLDWLSMGDRVITRTGFPDGLSMPELAEAFKAHTEAVKASVPADQLLVYEVKDGWEPLCEFLGQPVPGDPFPRTNSRIEFWDLLSGATPAAQPATPAAEPA
jgi:hypothetical protein